MSIVGLQGAAKGDGAGAEEPQAGAAVLLAWAAYASLCPAPREVSSDFPCDFAVVWLGLSFLCLSNSEQLH